MTPILSRYLVIWLFMVPSNLFAQAENQFGKPNILMGKAGVAGPPSLDAVELNPAHVGEVISHRLQARWGFTSANNAFRYPGFPAHNSKSQSLNPAMPFPAFLFKFNRRFGMSGILIPISVDQDIDVKELPIVILEQQDLVNLIGKGQLNGLVDLSFGYQLDRSLSMGLRFNYISIKANGKLLPSRNTSGDPIAEFDITNTKIRVGWGVKKRIDQLTLGLNLTVVEQTKQRSIFTSALNKDTNEGNSLSNTSTYLNPIRVGLAYNYLPNSGVLFDLAYTRAAKSQRRFSIVNFKEKNLDVYDTVSGHFGGFHQIKPRYTWLYGASYEPSAIGQGSLNENGKAGFGFFDLALNLGQPPEAPAWAVGTGMRFEFMPIATKRRAPPEFQMQLEAGFIYSETSIGIDSNGEQPGAYLVQRYNFPVRIEYRF